MSYDKPKTQPTYHTMKDISKAAAALGKRGGRAKTEAKAAAARENGQKGGRPTHAQRYDEFIRAFCAASRCDESHWAAYSSQLSDMDRREYEMRGEAAGRAMGLDYASQFSNEQA